MAKKDSIYPKPKHSDSTGASADAAAIALKRQHECAANATKLPKLTRLQTACRTSIHKQLSKLKSGSLTIQDASGQVTFGSPNQPNEVDAVIHVSDGSFYSQLASGGSLAAAESFLAGDWSTPSLVDTVRLLARNRSVLLDVDSSAGILSRCGKSIVHWVNRNSSAGSRRNIAAHYDLGNEFFELFLDPTMTYSSGIFEFDDAILEDASLAKYDRVCRQMNVRPENHLIEIGSGWGSFAIYAAQNYGCRVTTATISEAQYQYAAQRIESLGLEDRISLQNKDYRELEGKYDKLVSIEMIEAVGHKYLPTFFEKCSQLLVPNGQMMLQAITIPDQRYDSYRRSVDFIQKYIFPGGCLPSVARILNVVSSKTDLEISNLREFGSDYARTLQHWQASFFRHHDEILAMGRDENFLRAWEYYFAYCEAAFLEKQIGVCQLLFNKPMFRSA